MPSPFNRNLIESFEGISRASLRGISKERFIGDSGPGKGYTGQRTEESGQDTTDDRTGQTTFEVGSNTRALPPPGPSARADGRAAKRGTQCLFHFL